MKKYILCLCLAVAAALCPAPAGAAPAGRLLVLCYHDIPERVDRDNYGVDRESFVQQIEYLRAHGYRFVSLEDVLRAHRKQKRLPEKAVLLSFDDGYASFTEFVLPLLKMYRYPCVLAVITSWVGGAPPEGITQRLMDWDDVREAAASGLVEIASHTHDLHRSVVYNPQGNDCWAVASLIYDRVAGTYETEEAYRRRLFEDFERSRETLEREAGISPRTIVWPFGKYNRISIEEAQRAGFAVTFALEDRIASPENIDDVPRYILFKNPSIAEIAKALKNDLAETGQQRIVQADLDAIFDTDPARQERNLDHFIERICSLKPTTVYLQAFCDENADGNIRAVYFPNRVLPVKSDLFCRVVNQLAVRDIQVYAWMPMLSIVLPDEKENERLRVREYDGGEKRPSRSWYRRLSPFHPETAEKLSELYEDMAAHARIDGVLFQDDGYLNDFEDFNEAALPRYRSIAGDEGRSYRELSPEQKRKWTQAKTAALTALTARLKKTVRRWRPNALFARNYYAPALFDPESEEWLAQNYADGLASYDYVVIMAYPFLEEVSDPEPWLRSLVRMAGRYPDGLKKTVFKIQTYDWDRKRWVGAETANRWFRALVAAGARHVGYYPDDYVNDRPRTRVIRLMISAEDFPFERDER